MSNITTTKKKGKRDKLVRAALRLHRALSRAAQRRDDCRCQAGRVADWVAASVPALEQCRRRLAAAQERGWYHAAAHVEEELWRHLRRLGHHLESALAAPQPPRPAVPSANELLADLGQLRHEFGGLDVRWGEEEAGMMVCADTEPVTLEGVYLGDFSVRLNVDLLEAGRADASVFQAVALDPHPASSSETTTHPHVRDDYLCAGEASEPIATALREGRVADAFLLVRSVLTTYNRSSPFIALADWEGSECADCGGTFPPEDLYSCDHCDGSFCESCTGCCSGCGAVSCLSCLLDVGDERLCPGCAAACPRCGYNTAKCDLEEPGGICPDCREQEEQEAEDDPEDDEDDEDQEDQQQETGTDQQHQSDVPVPVTSTESEGQDG